MNINGQFIDGVVNTFHLMVPSGEDLCKAGKSTYNRELYNDRNSQIVYALRFLPAYYFEYCALGSELNKRIFNSYQNVVIASFGCGLCPDYYAFRDNLSVDFIYRGYDAVTWETIVHMPPVEQNLSLQYKGVESINTGELLDVDVFVFPKSITDISDSGANVIDSLTKKYARRKKVKYFS